MGIKRTIHPHTGLYERKTTRVVLSCDEEKISERTLKISDGTLKDLAEVMPSAFSQDPLGLHLIESEMTGFLMSYIENGIGGLKEKVRGEVDSAEFVCVVQNYVNRLRNELTAELAGGLSEEERRAATRKLQGLERAADACEVLSLIPAIRLRLKTDEQLSIGAISDGVMLGRAYERFRVRVSEAKAFTGDKILRGASAGGIAAKESAHLLYEKLAAAFRASGLSQRKFSAKFRIDRNRLKRALKEVGPNHAK
jgi:hypothetical protein